MVRRADTKHYHEDGSIQAENWLDHLSQKHGPESLRKLQHAISFAKIAGEQVLTATKENCFQQGLAMAELLDHLNLDVETLVCAILFPCTRYSETTIEDLREQFSPAIAKLAHGVAQMDAMRTLHSQVAPSQEQQQIDNLRKMLLAMVQDIRVVFIKLAERTCWMRRLKNLSEAEQIEIAQETHDIYSPLANRLGIGQLKWELEDLAFRYLNSVQYKSIAKGLDQKRIEREQNVQRILKSLEDLLKQNHILKYEIQGRAKHIYSIHRKMSRKKLGLDQIYDIHAVRVLVETVDQCYNVLAMVHSMWQPIVEEYDDYITNPKPNGYRSLHTAVKDEFGYTFEVQIRTFAMHQESELGVAAHWKYKEGGGELSSYDQKIAWLRELMNWQKEKDSSAEAAPVIDHRVFEDRVYVFTPNNEIVDLLCGSTPLDFAYQIHTNLGHRCRGAKVNGQIVPLTYKLKTGDRLEVLTAKQANPSRDWMNPNLGYLFSSRSRAKVASWFKKLDYDLHVQQGKELIDREIKRLHLRDIELNDLVKRFNRISLEDFYAGTGAGDIKLGQIVHALENVSGQAQAAKTEIIIPSAKSTTASTQEKLTKGIHILGVGNLLTSIAKCCHPVPGDAIIGYITQSRGIAIHRQDCQNILNSMDRYKHKMVEVSWGDQKGSYPVDVYIKAFDRHGLIRDISTVLSNEKVNVIAMSTTIRKGDNTAHVNLTLEVPTLELLSRLFDRIQQLSNILQVERKS